MSAPTPEQQRLANMSSGEWFTPKFKKISAAVVGGVAAVTVPEWGPVIMVWFYGSL